MSILVALYSAAGGIGLLLCLLHLLIWLRLRKQTEFLFAALMSGGAGVVALCEAGYLGQTTIEEYQLLLKVQNFGVGLTLIGMVWFVRLRLKCGRVWLAGTITVSWLICLAANFYGPGNLTFASLDALVPETTAWGEQFALPQGEPHPFRILSDITTLLIFLFVSDATIAAYRRGNRHQALLTGLPILFFVIVAGVHTPMVDAGAVKTPYMISVVFVAISLSLAASLVDDVARGARSNRALETERQRWEDFATNVDLAVLRIARDGRIADVNPYVEKVSGKPRSTLVGTGLETLFASETAAEARQLAVESDTWRSRSEVYRDMDCADGTKRQFVWFSVSLKDLAGRPDGVTAFGRDVTAQKEAEAERDETRREIEKLSRALTMGELASTFAHELSQPIAAVLSNAQTLELLVQGGDLTEDDLSETLGAIVSDARRARDLMRQVRAFVYNKSPEAEWFSLGEILREAKTLLALEAARSGVALRVQDDSVDQCFGARLELQQLVMNLVLNGIQAARARDAATVSLSAEVNESGLVRIQVDDTGPGLPKDTNVLFDPFVTSKAGGTGIGLAVVRRVAQRHGGSVHAGNNTAGGARFDVELPIGAAHRGAANG